MTGAAGAGPARIIDGTAISREIYAGLRERVSVLGRGGVRPGLAAVQVGDNPASEIYLRNKVRACDEVGIHSEVHHLAAGSPQDLVLATLEKLNRNPRLHGILLQLPLPPHLDTERVMQSVAPEKDVDGFHPESLGRLAAGAPRFVPCTPLGIRELLLRYEVKTAGANVVVLGRSVIVGKPMALLFALKGPGGDATVTICHSRSRDLAAHTRNADIIVAAMGVANFLKTDMVREGAVVVDVGINRIDDPAAPKGYRIVGDVDFEAVAPRCSLITPVPGGVGPMTVAMLMSNTLVAFRIRKDHVVR